MQSRRLNNFLVRALRVVTGPVVVLTLVSAALAQTGVRSPVSLTLVEPPPPGDGLHLPAGGPAAYTGTTILYNQTPATSTSYRFIYSSQESPASAFDSQAADDFIIPLVDGGWNIDEVLVRGVYLTPTDPPAVNVFFYADDGGAPFGLPGALVYSETLTATTDVLGNLFLDVADPLLIQGHYWVSVQPVQTFPDGWYWERGQNITNYPAAWQNPGDGFSTGCTLWAPLDDTCLGEDENLDLAFRINGEIGGTANLHLTKTAPNPIVAGTDFTYTIVVTNTLGSDPANSTVISDTLPAGVFFVSSTPGAPDCTEALGVVTCNVGTVGPGGMASVDITVHLLSSALDGDTFDNTACVTSNAVEADPSDNCDTHTTNVVREADVSIKKTVAEEPLTWGSAITYTVRVSNLGPSDASNTVITDTLPIPPLTYTGDDHGCTFSSPTLTCNLASLTAGSTEDIEIYGTLDPAFTGPLGNCVSSTANEPDPDSLNNTGACNNSIVYAVLDLSSVKFEDGWVLERTETSNTGGNVNEKSEFLPVGDHARNYQYKALFSFPTDALPDSATIFSATFTIRRAYLVNDNPFGTHGMLKVDIRKPWFGTNKNLRIEDFAAAADSVNFAQFADPGADGAYTTVDLPAGVFPFIGLTAGQRTQFRVYFGLDDNNDLQADQVVFYGKVSLDPANWPHMHILYLP